MDKYNNTDHKFLRTAGICLVSLALAVTLFCTFAEAGKKSKNKGPKDKRAAPDKAPNSNGVIHIDRSKCYNGFRLYSPRNTEIAILIDIDGKEMHRWSYEQGKTWHYAEMLPNGNLMAVMKPSTKRKDPGMFLELDWHSNVVRKIKIGVHHDIHRLANHNTLMVTTEIITNTKDPMWKDLKNGIIKNDVIVEMTPDDKIIWKWHGDKHYKEIAALVTLPPISGKDILHMNTVEELPENPSARKDKRFKKGNILFSAKKIDTIGVIDKKSRRVVWAWSPGEEAKQHMPTMLANGHILVYVNGQKEEQTRIVELDPVTEKIVWQYWGSPRDSFYSRTRGSNQRLPNGNTYIAESDSGRLFEVTSEGEIVWEFLNPFHHRKYKNRRQPLYRTVCYPRQMVGQLLAKYRSK